jgi:hypothetical protein
MKLKWIDPVVPCGSENAVDPTVPVVVSVVVSVVPQLQAVVVGIVVIPTAEEV